MKPNVAATVPLPQGTSRDRLLAPADSTCDETVTSCASRPRRDHLRAAMDRLGVDANHVALDWKRHHSYVSRVLSGEKKWPEDLILLLSDELRTAMVEEAAKDQGLVTGTQAALIGAIESLVRLAHIEPKPLKADLPAAAKKAAK